MLKYSHPRTNQYVVESSNLVSKEDRLGKHLFYQSDHYDFRHYSRSCCQWA